MPPGAVPDRPANIPASPPHALSASRLRPKPQRRPGRSYRYAAGGRPNVRRTIGVRTRSRTLSTGTFSDSAQSASAPCRALADIDGPCVEDDGVSSTRTMAPVARSPPICAVQAAPSARRPRCGRLSDLRRSTSTPCAPGDRFRQAIGARHLGTRVPPVARPKHALLADLERIEAELAGIRRSAVRQRSSLADCRNRKGRSAACSCKQMCPRPSYTGSDRGLTTSAASSREPRGCRRRRRRHRAARPLHAQSACRRAGAGFHAQLEGCRARTISKSSSRVRIIFTGARGSASFTRWADVRFHLVAEAAPTRGVTQRSIDIGAQRSHTFACTRNTD